MAENTSKYGTGYLGQVTITGTGGSTFPATTYKQAKMVKFPTGSAKTVKIEHLGGFTVQPDGRDSYGDIELTIPNDGAASFLDPAVPTVAPFSYTIAFLVAAGTGALAGKTGTATLCLPTKDDQGQAARGSSIDRKLTFELSAGDIVWA